MKKNVKKTIKKKRKISFAKRLFKTIGICLASVFGFLGASIGVYALFGGFNPKVVNLQGMAFEQTAYVLSGLSDKTGTKMLVGNKDNSGNVFESVKLLPTNEDATKLDITLSGGKGLVTYLEGNKVGSPLQFEIQQGVGFDQINDRNSTFNKTGEFKLTAVQEEDNCVAETKIFIESAVQSFNLVAQNASGNFDKNKIYPGNIFNLSVENVFPANAFDKPENCENPDNEFYKTYGANYFNKQALFLSSNESVATVNPLTGEVKVENVGEFTISCLIPKTYKNNMEMPSVTDNDFWSKVEGLTVLSSVTFSSKSIAVAGIRASTSTFENLKVFETYSYSTKSNNQGQNKINLDLSLLPPDSNFTASQLEYRLSDVQIFEGYKGSNGKFYILGGQKFAQKDGQDNKNIILSEHLTIKKEINPLSWSFRVESVSTKDVYLIARIVSDETTENEFSFETEDKELDTVACAENGIYYAFIKITLSKDVENESMSFAKSSVLAQFDSESTDKFLYISKDKLLDLTSNEIFTNPKKTQTYNIVKYFVSSGSEFVECTGYFDGANPELQLYSKTQITNPDGTTENEYIKDDKGGYIKLINDKVADINSSTKIEIYAAIFKYTYEIDETTGNYKLLDKNNKVAQFELIDNKYQNREDKSEPLTITVSKFIEFKDFVFKKNGNKIEDISNGITINKGDNIEISCTTTDLSGLLNVKDLFVLNCLSSIENLISNPSYDFTDLVNNIVKITFTALNVGTGTIALEFNGEKVSFGKNQNGIALTIVKNDVQSIGISSNALENNSTDAEFVVVPEPGKSGFSFKAKTGENSYTGVNDYYEFTVTTDGGTASSNLQFRLLNDDIYLNTESYNEKKSQGKIEIVAEGGLSLKEADDKLQATFKVFPHKLCENLQFYVYTMVDGVEVKSKTISLSVTGLKSSDITENKNLNNNITINSVDYQQVIGNEAFDLINTSETSVLGYLSISVPKYLKNDVDKLSFVSNLAILGNFEIPKSTINGVETDLFSASGFANVEEPTLCSLILKPSFWSENEYKTFNFYILSKYFVNTTTLDVAAGEEKTIKDLKSFVDLFQRIYDENNKPQNAYLGNIATNKIESVETGETVNPTKTFYKYDSNKTNNIGDEIADKYTAPNSILGDTDKIICKVEYTVSGELITKYGIINVNISANSEIKQVKGISGNLINNGEKIALTDLFNVAKTEDGTTAADMSVSQVVLTRESFEKLKQYKVKFYNNQDSKVEDTENMSSSNWNTLLKSIAEIEIPQDLNVYEIDGLFAKIIVKNADNKEYAKNNQEFSLCFQLTELNVKTGKVYIVGNLNDDKTYIINNYVISASLSSSAGSVQDVKDSLEMTVDTTNSKIIFTLNNIVVERDYVILSKDVLSKKDNSVFVVAKAYNVADLISSTDENITEEILSNATFVKLVNSDKTDVDTSKYSLQNANKILVVKESLTNCTVVVNMLGRDFEISGFDFGAITFSENLKDETYTSVENEIFDADTLKTIKNNNLQVEFSVFEGSNIFADYTTKIEKDTNIIQSFTANTYSGEAKTLTIKVKIYSKDFEGIELSKEVTLHSVVITAKNDGDTFNGNQVLIKGLKNYDLKDYMSIKLDNIDYDYNNILEFYIENDKLASLESYSPTVETDGQINLNIKIEGITIATIQFYVKIYELEAIASGEIYFDGQTITNDELRYLVNIVDNSGSVVENETLKNQITFSGNFTLKEGENSFVAKLGQIENTITITAQKATFTEKFEFTVYPDTRVSNYVSCSVTNSNGNSRNLTLNYKFDASDTSITIQENGEIQILLKNGTIIATLNTTTGALEIKTTLQSTIKVCAFIKGVEIPNEGTTLKSLNFTVTSVNKISPSKPIELYVGDQEYNLLQFGKYVVNNKDYADYEVYSISDNGQNLGYTYSENSRTKEFLISKNNSILAKIKFDKDNRRSILETSSALDSLTLTLKGYLNFVSEDYTLESLRNTYIELVVNIISIKVDFSVHFTVNNDEPKETTLKTISANGKDYYVLTSDINYELRPKIYNGNNSADLTISNITYQTTNKTNFIGKVNEELQLSFIKKLQNLTSSTSSLTLPNNNGTIDISQDNTKKFFKFTPTNPIVDYIFVSLDYSIGQYNGTVNICLQPKVNISFEYADENTNYATVFSPSSYKLSSSGTLLSFNKDLLSGNQIQVANGLTYTFDIAFSERKDSVPTDFNTTYSNVVTGNHTIRMDSNTSTGYNISISGTGNSTSYYIIRIEFAYTTSENGSSIKHTNYYYYVIQIEDIKVEVKDNTGSITTDNPIISKGGEINLKDYIYVNEKLITHDDNLKFNKNIVFSPIDNEIYTLSSDGIFTPKIDAFNVQEIQFSLFGTAYNIYIKGQELSVEFRNNGTKQDADFEFTKGETKYIYLTQENGDETKTIIVDFKDQKNGTTIDTGLSLNLKILEYNFSGTTITDSFDITISANKITYSFIGTVLLTLSKLDDCYELVLSPDLAGDLKFNVSPIYSQLSVNKTCIVKADVQISINYVNPVIYDGESYQNVLAGNTFDLSTIVSINKDYTLTYEILEGSNKYVALTNNLLRVSENLTEDAYLKIKVYYNTITRYVFVKCVPTTKNLTTGNSFTCLKNEFIDLTDYIKIYKFTGFDSQNQPQYEMLSSFTGSNETTISDPFNFVVSEEKTVKLDGNEYTFNVLTYSPSDLSFECFVGEKLNLRELVLAKLNSSTLTNKTFVLVFDSPVDENGNYFAEEIGTKTINFSVNGVGLEATITVSDLSIDVSYKSSVLKENSETLQTKKYENVHALQNEKELTNYISLSNKDYSSKLQFEISLVYAEEDKNGNKYDINKFVTQNSSLCGKNTILLTYEGTSLFAIGQNGFICFEELKYEVLLNIKLTLSDNTLVNNYFNIRLLPIKIETKMIDTITKEDCLSGGFNLNALIEISTTAKENNVILNDKIKFYNDELKDENLISNQMLTIDAIKSKYQIIASFFDKSYTFDITYNGGNDYASSLFNDDGSSGWLKNSSASIYAVGNRTIENTSTFVTFTTEIKDGRIYYHVYDQDSQKLFTIDSLGYVTNLASKKFDVTLYAQKDNIVETKVYSNSGKDPITFSVGGLQDINAKYVSENGTMVLELVANHTIDLTAFLNGATLKNAEGDFAGAVKGIDGTTITTENVSEITYGYFDVYKDDLSTRVYVKVYPFSLTKNYQDDFTFAEATVMSGTSVAINRGDTFKTFYTFDNNLEIDLNNYITKVSGTNFSLDVTYKVNKVVTYNKNQDKYNLFSSDYSSYASLSGTALTLKPNGIYYVYLTATLENKNSLNFAFKVLPVSDNTTVETLTIENNSYVDLKQIIKVVVTSKNETTDLFNELSFKLERSFNSKITGNILYVSEKDFNETITINGNDEKMHKITLKYSFQNIITNKSITINVTEESRLDANSYPKFNKNGTLFEEKWYDNTNITTLNSNITKINTAKIGDTNYDVNIENVKFTYNSTEFTVSCFKISNFAIILNDDAYKINGDKTTTKILDKATILFKNPNGDNYIIQNKIGIIYLSCEVNTCESVYKTVNYKLNNYSITKDNNSVYTYTLNGETVSNSLKFSLVLMDDNYNIVDSITTNSGTITISSTKTTINSNGITLNVQTGAMSGSKSNEYIKMFVKAYVSQENFNYGENFVLFKI